MQHLKIGFIGAGNMAGSIIGGLATHDSDYSFYASDLDLSKLNHLQQLYGVTIYQDNIQLLEKVDVLVLSVKPQVMQSVLLPLVHAYEQHSPLIISIAAGISSSQILNWLNAGNAACIRVMPNTPAMVQSGASGLYAVNCDEDQKAIAQNIMNAVGISLWVDNEDLIDTVTAVSGSGPAYFFYLMEAIYHSALKNGLDENAAKKLTAQTALGAAKLALSSESSFETLREQVTSPGGTTQAALTVLKEGDFVELIDNAVCRAAARSKELSAEN